MVKNKLNLDDLPLWVACDCWHPLIEHVVARGCQLLCCEEVRIPHDHFLQIDFRGTVEDLPEFKPGECNGQMHRDSKSSRIFCRCCDLRLVQAPYEWQGIMSEGLMLVRKDGKYGYLDLGKNLVIPLEFDDAKDFHSGLAAVRQGENWGYIDPRGKIIIEPRFLFAGDFVGNGTAFVVDSSSQESYSITPDGKTVAGG